MNKWWKKNIVINNIVIVVLLLLCAIVFIAYDYGYSQRYGNHLKENNITLTECESEQYFNNNIECPDNKDFTNLKLEKYGVDIWIKDYFPYELKRCAYKHCIIEYGYDGGICDYSIYNETKLYDVVANQLIDCEKINNLKVQ